MLKESAALELAVEVHRLHVAERDQLDEIRRYWRGRQKRPFVFKAGTPNEVLVMARTARVNVMPLVVNSLVQSAFVDGFRPGSGSEEDARLLWSVWQANRFDRRQSGLHRATAAYGAAYVIVVPGDPLPVMRPRSPRQLCCVYGEDADWPMHGLERLGRGLYRLFDEDAWYFVRLGDDDRSKPEFISSEQHGLGVTPIVRYLDEDDLDADDEVESGEQLAGNVRSDALPTGGQIAPLMDLQDQIDLTTFGLQVAQHFGAFRQRYVIGWTTEDEAEKLQATAAALWTFGTGEEGGDVDPADVRVGEFGQTDLKGYLESRDSSMRHVATFSQTPVHELIGDVIQMSAEALAAADAPRERKLGERKTGWGESHEQTFSLVGSYLGVDVPADAEVKWRDTSARAFAATVDGLGKLAQMLGVPVEWLWEKIPGATAQDIDRMRRLAAAGDPLADIERRFAADLDPAA